MHMTTNSAFTVNYEITVKCINVTMTTTTNKKYETF